MPNTTITDLPSASTATGAVVPVDQGGSTQKATPDQLLAAANGETKAEITTSAATSLTLVVGADREVIRCTAGTTVTVTVPSLPAGTRIGLVQEGAGQIQLSASGVSLRYDATTFDPHSAAQWSYLELLWLTTTSVLVVGDLALA